MLPEQLEPGPWWDSGILNPDAHGKLIQNRRAIAKRSGLGDRNFFTVWTKLPPEVTQTEKDWIIKIVRRQRIEFLGPAYVGKEMFVLRRIQQMTGALLRNHIDTRILSCSEIVRMSFDKLDVDPTVLFIPDLAVPGAMSSLAPQARKEVVNLIASRVRYGRATGVGLPSVKFLVEEAGERLAELLKPETFKIELAK
jgi:hypothetical protein